MEFAKYYDVTSRVDKLIEEKKIVLYGTSKEDRLKKGYNSIYICNDTNDFWICRVNKDLDQYYNRVEGKWLIERNNVDKYEFVEFIDEQMDTNLADTVKSKFLLHALYDDFINYHGKERLIDYIIMYDEDEGFDNWDCLEVDSLEEVREILDGGYGLITI